jgi:hypothetical protein
MHSLDASGGQKTRAEIRSPALRRFVEIIYWIRLSLGWPLGRMPAGRTRMNNSEKDNEG